MIPNDRPFHPSLPPVNDVQASNPLPAGARPQMPLEPYPYPPQPPPMASQSSSHDLPVPTYAADHQSVPLPKVGQTRCYWALLSSDLQFIYLDPVLASHLEEQAEVLIGKSLLQFVHPDEQGSAKQDLGSVLESRTLHGSVTRVRFSRLSRVRRVLGHEGSGVSWSEAEKIALDYNYMAVDIVINWAAEGLVLCFIHAIVDLTPDDNDEQRKTGWTNWCGTPPMSSAQINLLFNRLLVCVPQTGSMTRVFQILANTQDRMLLLSWPPDQTQRPNGRDFAKLVEDVQIGTGSPTNDAKTSCTRRYKAFQDMPPAFGLQVESIFIPHGTVIFACHKVTPRPPAPAPSNSNMQQIAYSTSTYAQQPSPQQYYDQAAPFSQNAYNYIPPPSQIAPPYPSQPQQWQQGVSNVRSGSYPAQQSQPQWSPAQAPQYLESPTAPSIQHNFHRSDSPSYPYASGVPTVPSSDGGSPTTDIVPPPRRRVSPGSTRDQYGSGGGRGVGNRPAGVLMCSSCKATSSPEWRKGPSGKKELCNACGLRYARSRAKKETQSLSGRKRKDKGGITKRESATPPTPVSMSSSFGGSRRSIDDSSFMPSSSASASPGDFTHSHHTPQSSFENSTPSPSPPASNINFVHYSPQDDNRSIYSNSSSQYHHPSPLSNPPVMNHSTPSEIQQMDNNGSISSYSSSRIHHPTSPVSPQSLQPASYERDREPDGDLHHSSELRSSGRRPILTHP